MKKIPALALIFGLLMAAAVAKAQAPAETKQVIPKTAATPKNASVKPAIRAKVAPINDAFAGASLRALKAIQGDVKLMEVTAEGKMLFSKQVVDAINAADSEARTHAETAMSVILDVFLLQHSLNNLNMRSKELEIENRHQYKYADDFERDFETRELLQKAPGIAALKNYIARWRTWRLTPAMLMPS